MNTPKNDRFQFQRNRFRKQSKKSLTKHIIISLLPKINIKITNLQNFFKKYVVLIYLFNIPAINSDFTRITIRNRFRNNILLSLTSATKMQIK